MIYRLWAYVNKGDIGMKLQRTCRSAFTLVELLVVIAVISVLMAILIPCLNAARERSKRVVCASRLQQIGQGIVIYASNYDDRCPETTTRGSFHIRSTIAYYTTIQDVTGAPGKRVGGPFNLGHLFHEEIIEKPEILYCSSAPKEYRYEDWAERYGWRYDNSVPITAFSLIATSYHYVPQSKKREKLENGQTVYKPARRLSLLNNRAPLALDVIDYNSLLNQYYLLFRHNSRNVAGMNILYADGSVRFRVSKDTEKDLWSREVSNIGILFDDDTFRTLLYSFCE